MEELKIQDLERGSFMALRKGREIYEKTHPTIAKMIKEKMKEVCEDKILQVTEKINQSRDNGNFIAFSTSLAMLKEWETEQSRLV